MKTTAGFGEPLPGLYIHFPFCLSKCLYCDFYSQTNLAHVAAFLAAAAKEMSLYRDLFSRFDTVYLGGGTPSLLSQNEIAFLWQKINENFSLEKDSEITIEVNPGDGICSYSNLRDLGFNRINLGVQSFSDATLSFLGRRHDAANGLRAIEDAREAGFENIGIDLIYGTPTETCDAFLASLALAADLPITHISCYQLTIEENTPLKKRLTAGEFNLPTEDEQLGFFMNISIYLEDLGFTHYEISNFARGESHQSSHNSKYWRHIPYLGIGCGAHSLWGNKRWWNPPSLKDYLENLSRDVLPAAAPETLNEDQLRLETIYLGLRTRRGIDPALFTQTYGKEIISANNAVLARLVNEGLLISEGETIRPTRRGMALADSLAILL